MVGQRLCKVKVFIVLIEHSGGEWTCIKEIGSIEDPALRNACARLRAILSHCALRMFLTGINWFP